MRTELEARGWDVREVRGGRVAYLHATPFRDGIPRHIRVKTRRSGDWQVSIREGDVAAPDLLMPILWAFVDLSVSPPQLYFAQDAAVRRDIRVTHDAYIAKYSGHRAYNDVSTHHAMDLPRVERLGGGWEVLGLPEPSSAEAAAAAGQRTESPSVVLRSALEGERRVQIREHRKRERRLRDAKIREARAQSTDGRLRCEVPGCEFDFEEFYGTLGHGYIQVHHLRPLGTREDDEETSLEELAIVCANCHAMIHLGGDTRPLTGLVSTGRACRTPGASAPHSEKLGAGRR